MMYTQDYDEKYPNAVLPNDQPPPADLGGYWSNNYWYWQQLLYPYTKSQQVYFCPSSTGANSPLKQSNSFNYGANLLIMRNDNGTNLYPAISLASVNSPAATYLIMDAGAMRIDPEYFVNTQSGWAWLPGSGPLGAFGYYATPANQPPDWNQGRHFDGVNVTYADGHVKWLKSSVVYSEAVKCKADVNCKYSYTTPLPTNTSAWNPFAN